MANFRFINEQGQDDTGRVATYLQKSLPISADDGINVYINPICYTNTFVFEGVQTTNLLIVNIASQYNTKSNKGDYLELIFAPSDSLEVYLSFCDVNKVLNAGDRFVAYFQYDGTNWLYTNNPSGSVSTPSVTSVNYVYPVNGNVDLGIIGHVSSVNYISPVNGNVDLGNIVNSVNNIAPVNGNVELPTDQVKRLKTQIIQQPNGSLFQGNTFVNQLPSYTLNQLAVGYYNIVFSTTLASLGNGIMFKVSNYYYGGSLTTRTYITESPPFDQTTYYIFTTDNNGTFITDYIGFYLEFEIYP